MDEMVFYHGFRQKRVQSIERVNYVNDMQTPEGIISVHALHDIIEILYIWL